jgi:hypothetical protein
MYVFEYLKDRCSAGFVSRDGLETGHTRRRWLPYLDFVNRIMMLAYVPAGNGDMTTDMNSYSEIRGVRKNTRSRYMRQATRPDSCTEYETTPQNTRTLFEALTVISDQGPASKGHSWRPSLIS